MNHGKMKYGRAAVIILLLQVRKVSQQQLDVLYYERARPTPFTRKSCGAHTNLENFITHLSARGERSLMLWEFGRGAHQDDWLLFNA